MSTSLLINLEELSSREPVVHIAADNELELEQGNTTSSPPPPPFPIRKEEAPTPGIVIDHILGTITFKIQDGPIKENGKNGCQVDDIIEVALEFIKTANSSYPCRENAAAITKLEEALMWLEKRKKNRVKRGVEGYNQQ